MYPRNIGRRPYNNYYYPSRRNNERLFFPGGFVVPFVLGGIAGSALSRPNYGYYQPAPWLYSYPSYNNYYFQENPYSYYN